MSPIIYFNYLYYNSDIILSKTDGYVSLQMSVCQQRVLKVTLSFLWHVRVRSAFTTYVFMKITLKRCFHFIGSTCY